MVKTAAMDDRVSNARISTDCDLTDCAMNDRAIDAVRAPRVNRCR
jgi:hypothetical protein